MLTRSEGKAQPCSAAHTPALLLLLLLGAPRQPLWVWDWALWDSPEQMTAALLSWEHGEAPRAVTGHCPRWASVPLQWNESLQTGPGPLPKCPPLGMDSANPQLR